MATWATLQEQAILGFPIQPGINKLALTFLYQAESDFSEIHCYANMDTETVSAGNSQVLLSDDPTTGFAQGFLAVDDERAGEWDGQPLKTRTRGELVAYEDTSGSRYPGTPQEIYFGMATGVQFVRLVPEPAAEGDFKLYYYADPQRVYETPASSPRIPAQFHRHLVDYARAELYMSISAENMDPKLAVLYANRHDMFMARYTANKEAARIRWAERDKASEAQRVHDMTDSRIG